LITEKSKLVKIYIWKGFKDKFGQNDAVRIVKSFTFNRKKE